MHYNGRGLCPTGCHLVLSIQQQLMYWAILVATSMILILISIWRVLSPLHVLTLWFTKLLLTEQVTDYNFTDQLVHVLQDGVAYIYVKVITKVDALVLLT